MLETGKNSSAVFSGHQENTGYLSIASNGSMTLKSIEGKLSILDRERKVLAVLSSNESVAVSSSSDSKDQKIVIVQVPASSGFGYSGGGEFLGMSAGSWGVLAAGALGLGGMGVYTGQTDTKDPAPICP